MHMAHHLGEIDFRLVGGDSEARGLTNLMGRTPGTNQRLGGHAAGIEAVTAHLVALDQRDTRIHGRGDIAGDQPGGTGTDDDHVVIKGLRLVEGRLLLALAQHADDLLGDQREEAQRDEGGDQPRREDAGQGFQLAQLTPGVHVDGGARQHAQLACHVEGDHAHAGQAHHQIDDEEREDRHQAQREQIEAAFALDATVEGFQLTAEALLDALAQQSAGNQEGQRRTDGAGEGDQQQPPAEAEQRATQQRQQCCTGQ